MTQSMQRRLLAAFLALALLLGASSALAAYNDHTDYSQFPLVKEGEHMTVSVAMRRSINYGNDPDKSWFWIWSQQVTGLTFDVEQILASAVEERKSLMFASGDLPDLLFGISLSTSELVRYGMGEGLLLPLNDRITPEVMPHLSDWLAAYPESLAYCTTPDGNAYTFPGYSDFYIQGEGPITLQINQEWLAECGLNPPTTLDEFTAMLYAFKEKYPESIPLGGGALTRDPRGFLLNAFGYVWPDVSAGKDNSYNQLGIAPSIREGEVVLAAYDAPYADFLAMLHQYYADGLIAEDFFTLDQTTAFAQVAENRVGAFPNAVYHAMPDRKDFEKWDISVPLTSAWSDTPKVGMLNKFRYGLVSLSADVDPAKIDTILRYLDFFYSDLGGMYLWCGPSHTSADTLGIIGGYLVDENKSYVWVDVDGNPINSQEFMEGQAANMAHGFGNRSHPLDPEVFAKGVTNRPEMRSYYYDANNVVPYAYDPNFGSGANLLGVNKHVEPYRVASYPLVVYFDEETTLAIDDLLTIITPYVQSEAAKFITGARDLTEFPQYLKELEALGIGDLLGYYREAYDNYVNAM